MNDYQEIDPRTFKHNPFKLIGMEWMLILAENAGRANVMTASWGGLGFMWRRNVAFIVIRPQRYTKEFIDAADCFSLSFLGNEYREKMNYIGTVSGRTENKIAKAGLTLAQRDGILFLAEANTVILCKKLFAQPFQADSFIAKEIIQECYPDSDFHTLYIAEVKKLLVRE